MPTPHKTRRLFGYDITRNPQFKPDRGVARTLLIVGALVTLIHETVYRETGGTDYPLWGVVSHAGTDMLLLLVVLTITAKLVEARR